ncbi:unnamed protein product [Cunninghamella blakesleeana]
MDAPNLHGLNPTFTINENTCNLLKINSFISVLPAKRWCSIPNLADALLQHHNYCFDDADKAFQLLKQAFNTIAKKRSKHLSLKSFCKELVSFLTQNHVKKSFMKIYNDKIKEQQTKELINEAHSEGYNNSIRLSILGSKKLEKEIKNASNHQDTISNTSVTDVADSSSCSTTESLTPINKEDSIPPIVTNLGKHDLDNKVDSAYSDQQRRRKNSIETILKKEALHRFEEFKKGNKLTVQERKLMSSGLSSILDLIDLSNDGQKSLFENDEWELLKAKFMNEYVCSNYVLPSKITNLWNTIVGLTKADNGFYRSRNYVTKVKQSSTSRNEIKMLSVFEVLFDILENHERIFQKQLYKRFTEYDYLLKIWGPIMEAILSINKNMIRIKSGESINQSSSQMKQQQYSDSSRIGFKIDVRFIYDGEDDEYDIGVGELAIDSKEKKLYHDLGKLLREGKDVLDGMLRLIINEEQASTATAWVIQLCGLQGHVSSIHLTKNGLYVAVPQCKLLFPSSISNIDVFLDTFRCLLLFFNNLESTAHNIENSIKTLENRRLSIGKTFCRSQPLIPPNTKQSLIQPTWYSPSNEKQASSKLPEGFKIIDSTIENNIQDNDENIKGKKKYH